jgi:hypothetical protein
MRLFLKSLWLVLMLIAVGGAVGCATSNVDAENKGERPWNAPQGWENGMPPSMMQGR